MLAPGACESALSNPWTWVTRPDACDPWGLICDLTHHNFFSGQQIHITKLPKPMWPLPSMPSFWTTPAIRLLWPPQCWASHLEWTYWLLRRCRSLPTSMLEMHFQFTPYMFTNFLSPVRWHGLFDILLHCGLFLLLCTFILLMVILGNWNRDCYYKTRQYLKPWAPVHSTVLTFNRHHISLQQPGCHLHMLP